MYTSGQRGLFPGPPPPPQMVLSSPYGVYEGSTRPMAYSAPLSPGYSLQSPYVPVYGSATAYYGSAEDYQQRGRSKRSSGKDHKREKKDKQRSTLNDWTNWRTSINEDLSRDILQHTYRDIPVGDDYNDLTRSSAKAGNSVYHYSTAIDQATRLAKDDYINFGIPRATADTTLLRREGHTTPELSSGESDTEKPFYSIHKLNGYSVDATPRRQQSRDENHKSSNRHSHHDVRSPSSLNGRDARYFSSR